MTLLGDGDFTVVNLDYSSYLSISTGSSDLKTKTPNINLRNLCKNVHKVLNPDTLF